MCEVRTIMEANSNVEETSINITVNTVEVNEGVVIQNEGDEPAAKKVCLKRSYGGESPGDGGESSVLNSVMNPTSLLLEKRLSSVLCCTVCLDLPFSTMFQCPNGHLVCAICLNHLLADGRLKNEIAKCPNCRIKISETLCTRNLAVEKAVSELPTKCKFCKCDVPRCGVEMHERNLCSLRLVPCKFAKIGCHWQGISQTKMDHEEQCVQARKSGSEIMEILEKSSREQEKKISLYKSVFALFSYGKTSVHDLHLKPKRTNDYVEELFYESDNFSSFGQDWMIRSQVVGNEMSLRRGFTFQLILMSKCKMFVKFLFVQSPYGDLRTCPVIFQHEFSKDSQESLEQDLPVSQDVDINKLLAARDMPIRMIMFVARI